MPPPKTLESKIVLLGSQGVGKTSLVVRYVQGTFSTTVTSTIGASFFPHKMTVDGWRVKLQIWDTAGQERFRSMAPMYYRGASAAMLVYDVAVPQSFNDIQSWVRELQRNTEEDTILCIIGNKTDLRDAGSITTERGREFAEGIGASFYETSAKTDNGISEAFLHITRELLSFKNAGSQASTNQGDSIAVGASVSPPAQSKCCGGGGGDV